jgi:tungstate transport system ATP-binding protein
LKGHINVKEVSKTYDNIIVLDSISLDMTSEKLVSLVGVNGSGKTTLLRIIAGLDEPTKGNVIFNNQILRAKNLRRIETMVFQKNIMFDNNVFDNVAFGLKIRDFNKEEIENKVEKALISVGLDGFENRKAKKLSGGEQQRVALARAFVIEPEILLLDEPTANLDPSNSLIIEQFIRKIREENGCVVILATHNLYQAKRLSDMIIHIHSGKILDADIPKRFFSNPSNEVTKKFINGELQF